MLSCQLSMYVCMYTWVYVCMRACSYLEIVSIVKSLQTDRILTNAKFQILGFVPIPTHSPIHHRLVPNLTCNSEPMAYFSTLNFRLIGI